jgi:hypothetical protein
MNIAGPGNKGIDRQARDQAAAALLAFMRQEIDERAYEKALLSIETHERHLNLFITSYLLDIEVDAKTRRFSARPEAWRALRRLLACLRSDLPLRIAVLHDTSWRPATAAASLISLGLAAAASLSSGPWLLVLIWVLLGGLWMKLRWPSRPAGLKVDLEPCGADRASGAAANLLLIAALLVTLAALFVGPYLVVSAWLLFGAAWLWLRLTPQPSARYLRSWDEFSATCPFASKGSWQACESFVADVAVSPAPAAETSPPPRRFWDRAYRACECFPLLPLTLAGVILGGRDPRPWAAADFASIKEPS